MVSKVGNRADRWALARRYQSPSDRLAVWLNLLLYEIGWFGVVVGVSLGHPWFGQSIAVTAILIHIALANRRRAELVRLVAAVTIGFAVEAANARLGVYLASAGLIGDNFAPWLLVIWAGFSTSFYGSLRWLSGRHWLAIPVGLLAGPLAFWAGERLGALSLSRDPILLGVLALEWAVSLPLLVWISDSLLKRPVVMDMDRR